MAVERLKLPFDINKNVWRNNDLGGTVMVPNPKPSVVKKPDELPQLPAGYVFVVDTDGSYLIDADGSFLITEA